MKKITVHAAAGRTVPLPPSCVRTTGGGAIVASDGAVEIEQRYSKDEILRMYCNQVYMGHGRYGLEAASQFYFGKHAMDLDLTEAALLAGVIQRPSK